MLITTKNSVYEIQEKKIRLLTKSNKNTSLSKEWTEFHSFLPVQVGKPLIVFILTDEGTLRVRTTKVQKVEE